MSSEAKPKRRSKAVSYNQISSSANARVFSQDYYDILDTFNKIASKYPLLNKQEERAMIDAYRNDRSHLNHLLFCHNIRIILNLAKKYLKTATSAADLLMNGAHGLMIAAERFDLDRNIKFNTYATKWVFKYLLMCFYSKSPVTGINQTSLNDPYFGSLEDGEQMDFLNSYLGSVDDISTSFAGSPMNLKIDYTKMGAKPPIPSPSKECEEVSNTLLVRNVINEISSNSQFSEIDRDIIYNNMMENNCSISGLAHKYHIPTKEINKRKSKIISDFKTLLADKYKINSLRDVI